MYANKLPLCETSFPRRNNQAHLRGKSLRFFRSVYESDTGQNRPVLPGES